MAKNTRPATADLTKAFALSEVDNPFGSQADPSIRVQILNKQNRPPVAVGSPFLLEASASKGSEDLSSEVYWYSRRDGFLGRGESVVATVGSGGKRRILAMVVSQGSTAAKARKSATSPSEDDLKIGVDIMSVCATDPDPYSGGDTC